ncbi:unnamed protein product [Arabis nemorensis]|uniref:Uncharacterized protein n=1 Tax=Arabis nemorensis TaxID=586526 RepID=A0A565C539_9BRAS|nr:unnamed protein product [Arabis nemorensis]
MMTKSISIAEPSISKRFIHRNLKWRGNFGTAPSSSNHCGLCCSGRDFSSGSDMKLNDAVDLLSEMVKSRPLPSIRNSSLSSHQIVDLHNIFKVITKALGEYSKHVKWTVFNRIYSKTCTKTYWRILKASLLSV